MSGLKGYLRLLAAILSVMLLISLTLTALFSCKAKSEKVDFLSLSADELEKYVDVGEYKSMSISLDGREKETAVWNAVLENADVLMYPEEHVAYYVEQIEEQYKHYADQANMRYKEMLKQLGESKESIEEQAKDLTKKDIVYSVIVKKESISVSDSEKTAFFEKYVERYAQIYSRDAEYVRNNMSEEIYSAMLYDKTTEFLIVSNDIT